jgi:DNA-binding transcriptional LysR family regulator
MGRLAAQFAVQHPEVRLEVTTEDRTVDMIEEGYDLVIRVNPDQDESLVGRPFLHDRLMVVAAPALHRSPKEATPAVVRGDDPTTSWMIASPKGPVPLPVEPVLRLSSLVMIRDAVRAGAGAARLPVSLVGRDVAAGRLMHWGDVAGSDIALWALYPTRRLLNARVSAFLELLRQAFPNGTPEDLAAYLDGDG